MKDTELKKMFFDELRESVPDRKACRLLGVKNLKKAVKDGDINVFLIEELLSEKRISLSVDEIPSDLWFELVLYFILGATHDKDSVVYYANDFIFNMEDEETAQKVMAIATIINSNKPDRDLATITLTEFLAYAKSKKPSF